MTNSIGMMEACERGDLSNVIEICESGYDFHYGDEWALRVVCCYGHLDIIKYLVEHGADIHAGDDLPLQLADGYGHIDTAKYLQSVVRKEKLARLLK